MLFRHLIISLLDIISELLNRILIIKILQGGNRKLNCYNLR